jgi:hypothetical protein
MSLNFGLKSYSRTVTTAGTRVPLSATALKAYQIAIRAKTANTGVIYIGGSDVTSAGYQLAAGQTLSYGDLHDASTQLRDFRIDLTQIYIDSSVNGEGVEVVYAAEFQVVD